MDIYARNGHIVRMSELAPGVAELELSFPLLPREEALVIGLAIAYLALHERRRVPFVVSSPTHLAFAVRADDLGDDTRAALVWAVEVAARNVTRLLAYAELDFFGQPDKGTVDTDRGGVLAAHRQVAMPGRRFLERFAAHVAHEA